MDSDHQRKTPAKPAAPRRPKERIILGMWQWAKGCSILHPQGRPAEPPKEQEEVSGK